MKKITASLFFFFAVFFSINTSHAQVGFNPEYLGNAAGAPRAGFCLKFFTSYFYQRGPKAHDAEVVFEPQVFIPGFSGDINKDQIQFIAHIPVGYRRQENAAGGTSSVTGIGSLAANIEHFWHIIDEEDLQMWLDHAIMSGYPTATEHEGVRIGADAYSIGAFEEMFIRKGNFIASIMPLMVDFMFGDSKTNVRSGLTLGIMNSSLGYQLTEKFALGLSYGLFVGNVAGTADIAGDKLAVSVRAYAGPAFSITLPKDSSLQISGIVDFYTKEVDRGQGIFMALWHQF